MKCLSICSICILSAFALPGQKEYKIAAVGFYNLENLFDTLDAPDVRDEEFTPAGPNLYNTRIYVEKMGHLARVVSELGTEFTPDGVSILGVSEVENLKVLEDFVTHPKIKDRNYQIVHYDSPDERGIDVGLLYNPKYFKLSGSKVFPLLIYRNGKRDFTRDVLLVSGQFDGEEMHFLVNHWPSRGGGEAASQPFRNAAALICKTVTDSLMAADPNAKIIIMGDLNDDPTSPSVKEILQAKEKQKAVRKGELYNPMYVLYKKGFGTLAYRDAWSLFDQIILSYAFANGRDQGYHYYQTRIHNPTYMVQKSGHFKGYPFRTFAGPNYLGGYSDHFPVYVYLGKEVEQVEK